MGNTATGFLLMPNGTAQTIEVVGNNGSHLAHMRTLIEAQYVDVVAINSAYGPVDAWVDDEGAFTAIPNVLATVVLSELAGRQMQPIFGRVLLLSREGEDAAALSDDQLEYVMALHALALEVPGMRESVERAYLEAILAGRA